MKHLTYANVMSTIAVLLASTGTAYAAGYIGSAQIIDKSIQGRDVKSQAIGFRHIRWGSVDGGSHISSGSVDSLQLAPSSVRSSEIGIGAVSCTHLDTALRAATGC